jgi:hypothetical protein
MNRFLLPTAPLDLEGARRQYLEALLGPQRRCACCGSDYHIETKEGLSLCGACGTELWVDGD